jgi:hypothetical protein
MPRQAVLRVAGGAHIVRSRHQLPINDRDTGSAGEMRSGEEGCLRIKRWMLPEPVDASAYLFVNPLRFVRH